MSVIDKVIEIKCGGEVFLDFEELKYFQGELKFITNDDFNSLKESLIKNGLPLSFHIWVDKDGKNWILDGHHRFLAFGALKDEGYLIPKVPCNIVKAKNKKEAAKILLISNSKYAKMTNDKLLGFMSDFSIEIPDLKDLILPDIDLEKINFDEQIENNEDNTDEENNEKKIDSRVFICTNCGAENLK